MTSATQRQSVLQQESESAPCTCALYTGAVVLLEANSLDGTDTPITEEDLESFIATILNRQLVSALRNKPAVEGDEQQQQQQQQQQEPQQDPFYTEIKGASASWTAAERKPGGKLYLMPSPPKDETILDDAAQLTDADDPVAPENENADGTVIDVVNSNNINSLQGQESSNNGATASAFQTRRGKILASVLGGLLLLALVAIVFCLRRSRNRRSGGDNGDDSDCDCDVTHLRVTKETITVLSTDDYHQDRVDEEIANPSPSSGRGRSLARESTSSSMEEDCEDASAAAQYVHVVSSRNGSNSTSREGSNLLDSISVGSEWTLTTGLTTALGGMALASSSDTSQSQQEEERRRRHQQQQQSKTAAAEMQAAKETFDRDRQITLQKDMLQSEWTSGGAAASALAAASSATASPGLLAAAGGSGGALQFQDATGQGEEIFLVEEARPTTTTKRR
eukprot:jgi/Psemu1/290578/fgenesh1_pg.518_\